LKSNNNAIEIKIELSHTTLAALSWGDKTKPAILALHGWLDNAASFSQLAPLLEDYYIVAIDMPGHGYSDHLAEGQHYHLSDSVDVVIQVLNYFNWDKAILMGHSLGGAISTFTAASFPERVDKLILIDSIGPLSEESVEAPGRLRQSVLSFTKMDRSAVKTYPDKTPMIGLRSKINNVPKEAIAALVERAIKKVEGGYQWRFDSKLMLPSPTYYSEQKVLSFIQSIEASTLIIEAQDGILSDNTMLRPRQMAFQNLQVRQLAGGHHVHLSHAEDVANEIREFLS
jgi:pimeloyl-ACP methyl ester carboxylesterase